MALEFLPIDEIRPGQDRYLADDSSLASIALIETGRHGVTFVFEDGTAEYVRTDIAGHEVTLFGVYRPDAADTAPATDSHKCQEAAAPTGPAESHSNP